MTAPDAPIVDVERHRRWITVSCPWCHTNHRANPGATTGRCTRTTYRPVSGGAIGGHRPYRISDPAGLLAAPPPTDVHDTRFGRGLPDTPT